MLTARDLLHFGGKIEYTGERKGYFGEYWECNAEFNNEKRVLYVKKGFFNLETLYSAELQRFNRTRDNLNILLHQIIKKDPEYSSYYYKRLLVEVFHRALLDVTNFMLIFFIVGFLLEVFSGQLTIKVILMQICVKYLAHTMLSLVCNEKHEAKE